MLKRVTLEVATNLLPYEQLKILLGNGAAQSHMKMFITTTITEVPGCHFYER